MTMPKVKSRFRIPPGVACALIALAGYLLEWVRQRGDCEFGDKSPDTLAISIIMIVIVGGLGGAVSLVSAVIGSFRHGLAPRKLHLASAIVSLISVVPLFLFAGAGPSTWFQYCAT